MHTVIADIIKGSRDHSVFVYFLVFCSGFTGLVYQVVWQKYLTYYMGSHGKATALILAVFFLSLSLGYRFFGRWGHLLLKNKLFLFGIIEGLIGAYCLASPLVFTFLSSSYPQSNTGPVVAITSGMVFTFCFIGFPTFLMGGTIPILTEALVSVRSRSHRIHAIIYGTNTAGAFAGTICAGFILIETWGLPLTLLYTALVNILICGYTYIMFKTDPHGYSGVSEEPSTALPAAANPPNLSVHVAIMIVSFMSGFYVFSLETIIIRMAGVSLGSTTYTFSIIVASFILALALGSLFISMFEHIIHYRILIVVQSTLLLSWILVYVSIPDWPIWFSRLRLVFSPHYFNFNLYWLAVFCLFLFLLLIPVGLMGMNLPLLFNYLKSSNAHYSTTVGRIYSVNTLASTLGAAVGGYLLFLFLRTDDVFRLNLILIASTLPIVAFLTLKENRLRVGSMLLSASAIVISYYIPAWGDQSFSPPARSALIPNKPNVNIQGERRRQLKGLKHIAHVHGPDSIVDVVEDEQGQATLFVNSHGISHTKLDRHIRALNALLPMYLSPRVETAFFVGLGAGLGPALTTHLPGIKSVDVAEISKGIIDVREYFRNFHGAYAAKEDKVRIIHSDALAVLRQSTRTYDMIVSEPAHPWVSGVENLYSEEFLSLAKTKMSSSGIYAQWFPMEGLDDDTMMTIINTFHSVFPGVTLWSPSDGVILILASKTAVDPSAQRLKEVYNNYKDLFGEFGFNHYLSPLVLQVMSQSALEELLTKFQGRHSIEFPKVAYRSGRSLFARDSASLQRMVLKVLEVPDGKRDYRFIYEKLPEAHTEEFFKSAFRPASRFRQALKSVKTRFEMLYKQAYPTNKEVKVADDVYQDYKYLMTGDDRFIRAEDERNGEFLSDMYGKYISIISVYLPAQYDALTRLIPGKCEDRKCEDTVRRIRAIAKPGVRDFEDQVHNGNEKEREWTNGL